jgi:hypothetical protein
MVKTPDLVHGACKDFEQDLVLYHYQECSGTEQRRMESHLETCASCRRFLEELKGFLPATVNTDEPSPAFWQSYSREMRAKLSEKEAKSGSWWTIASFFRPWPVPALAMAMILALAVTLTLTKGRWASDSNDNAEFVEMASNADFFNSLDFLDSMDLLDDVETKEAQIGEKTPQHL